MKHILKSILVAGALAFASHQARAEKFLVTLRSYEYLADAAHGGLIVRTKESNRTILADAAAEHVPALDPKTLALVFDNVADQVQVVKKADGSVIAVEYEMRGGNLITSSDGVTQYRQAFLYKDGAATPSGSVSGEIDRSFGPGNALVAYEWLAKFQLSEPTTAPDEPAEVIEGTFRTGALFVPTP